MPATLIPSSKATITPNPLTPASFAPFGTAVSSGLPIYQAQPPAQLPTSPSNVPTPILANQSTALKYSPISPFRDTYNQCPSGKPSSPRVSLFASFPRQLRRQVRNSTNETTSSTSVFDVSILERHPYTTQMFVPMGLAGDDPLTTYLVIVAPSLAGQTVSTTVKSDDGKGTSEIVVRDPPDLNNIKAFVVRGDKATTYGAGTWHAPMVVLGSKRVDFVVVQSSNGVAEEDCQEVNIADGITVDVGIDTGTRDAKL